MSITEVLLECSRTYLSTYCVRLLLYPNSRLDLLQQRLTRKAGNIYCLVLYQKSLPASDIKLHLVIFLISRFILF